MTDNQISASEYIQQSDFVDDICELKADVVESKLSKYPFKEDPLAHSPYYQFISYTAFDMFHFRDGLEGAELEAFDFQAADRILTSVLEHAPKKVLNAHLCTARTEHFDRLIAHGAEVDESGALYRAAQDGNLDRIGELIRVGANPHIDSVKFFDGEDNHTVSTLEMLEIERKGAMFPDERTRINEKKGFLINAHNAHEAYLRREMLSEVAVAHRPTEVLIDHATQQAIARADRDGSTELRDGATFHTAGNLADTGHDTTQAPYWLSQRGQAPTPISGADDPALRAVVGVDERVASYAQEQAETAAPATQPQRPTQELASAQQIKAKRQAYGRAM